MDFRLQISSIEICGVGKLRNEELLEAIRAIFESYDKDLDKLTNIVSYMKGTLDEMKRHNGRVIKVLAGIITTLLGIIGYLVSR